MSLSLRSSSVGHVALATLLPPVTMASVGICDVQGYEAGEENDGGGPLTCNRLHQEKTPDNSSPSPLDCSMVPTQLKGR